MKAVPNAIVAIVFIASGRPAVCDAMPPKDTSYFCTVEFSGGIAFDQNLRKWESAKFRPESKFVLKLKYLKTRTQKDQFTDKDETITDFNVTLTQAGSGSPQPCHLIGQDDYSATIPIYQYNVFSCTSSLSEYHINLRTNRFISSYMYGYIDGRDNNDNTPSVSGGTCTKIDY